MNIIFCEVVNFDSLNRVGLLGFDCLSHRQLLRYYASEMWLFAIAVSMHPPTFYFQIIPAEGTVQCYSQCWLAQLNSRLCIPHLNKHS
jgi:hypothetical protein